MMVLSFFAVIFLMVFEASTFVETVVFKPALYSEAIGRKAVINAAGVYADAIHNMVCADKIHITARKGEYCL